MRASKTVLSLLVLAALAAGIAERQASGQAAPQHKPRIAILDFDYATVQTASAAIFGTEVDIGKGITNLLVTDLVKDGSYSVIERSALDKVLAEQNFSNSNRANPNSAAAIGKILGVDYIVVGAITEFGNETKKQSLGGIGGGLGGFGLGGVGHSNSKANVAIDARVINIDTAEIMAVASGKAESSRSGVSLGGGGGNWSGFGGGNVDFGSSNFQNTIIGEATKKATEQLAADLVSNAAKLPVHAVKVDALVAAVDGGQIILNAGTKAGISVGDQLSVVRVGKEIRDPATGQVIRRLTSTVGTIQATDVDDTSAVCNVVSGSGFQVGDHAVTPGTSPGVGGSSAPAAAPAPQPQSSTPAAAPARASAAAPAAPPASAAAPAAAAGAGSSDQPNFTAIKADFVPGDKVILLDDFADMQGDEPPPHWKVRGGTAELRVAGNLRQIAIHGGETNLVPNIVTVPKNFTLDYDVFYSTHWEYTDWYFSEKTGKAVLKLSTRRNYDHLSISTRGPDNEAIYEGQLKLDFTQPHHVAYWVQEGRMRMYVDGERIFDVNQIQFNDLSAPRLEIGDVNEKDDYVGLRNIRFAESSPDFGKTILSSGKFVTHGILFATDSDTITADSAAVLQQIGKGLTANPDLKVEIDGHTDSTGAAPHNMELSKRRAEAVKNVLVSQFGIDASRLTTAGFGSTKPIDSNDTPTGKANNRRVEFVKK